MTNKKENWEEEYDKRFGVIAFSKDLTRRLKSFIKTLLKQQKQKIKEEVSEVIEKELEKQRNSYQNSKYNPSEGLENVEAHWRIMALSALQEKIKDL